MSTDYSRTPLVKKLGIKADMALVIQGEPTRYLDLLDLLPEDVHEAEAEEDADFIHYFTDDEQALTRDFPGLRDRLGNNKQGSIWISWPKKTSPKFAGLLGPKVRAIGLQNGLVDVKVCAVDEDWSGMKFMYRVKDR